METLDGADDRKNQQFANWDAITTPPMSIIEMEKLTIDQSLNHLQVIANKDLSSNRPIIPATTFEKLAFYRSYVSSPSITQMITTQQIGFNRFLWFHIMNLFCKSLPNMYIYMFLSSYVPDQHLFLSKMLPIALGANWAFVIASFMYLITYTDTLVTLLDYLICGLLYKNPWNRCSSVSKQFGNWSAVCYTMEDFSSLLENDTVFQYGVYISHKNVSFQLAPIVYYRKRFRELQLTYEWVYFALLWILAVIHYKQLYRRYIWKMLNNVQMILNILYVISFSHIIITYFETDLKNIPAPNDELTQLLWEADMDILSESMTAPPIVHVITSRSTRKVNPDRDSIAVTLSNSLYYVFRGLLGYNLKRHCERMVKSPIYLSEFNPNSFLYLWPLYFSSFSFGNVYTLMFFALSFLMEFFTITISIQCMIETIVYEWRWAKRKVVTAILCFLGVLLNVTTEFRMRVLLYVYSTSVVTTFEVLVIYCLYPLGRLVDDITFYRGVAPTRFRVLNFRIVPIYYCIKMYEMYKGFFNVIKRTTFLVYIPHYRELLYLIISPFVFGAFYAVYICLFVKKKNLQSLVKPLPEWGPKNSTIRHLRKLYDSRKYVGSEAPRKLSHFVINRSNLESYKLDILYDNNVRKPSANVSDNMQMEDEKKRK